MMYQTIRLEYYTKQKQAWPKEGKHILAQYDADSVIVYQAYRPAIGLFAVENQYFGGEFSLNRMSWIKPNFLWMMYRSNWARTPGQEIVCGVRLKRDFFDEVVRTAVPSSFDKTRYKDQTEWKRAVKRSSVRLQWDPDHGPSGNKCERRAIQLGLRGDILEQYSRDAIIEIINMTPFIQNQISHLAQHYNGLLTPEESIYPLP
ncbi:MAG: DUF4291 domain-containing protein [Gammaproteobacteria bacterium]|nr:DUF4291 domain-containing protein [Gammaproteobacteria bacterium]MDH5652019.1 DUF4291 domain-containing protein [Gammaproteobacteria bacterium]